jgi:ABC-type multidrug transport system permease subunit
MSAQKLIRLLIVGLILVVIYIVCGMFIGGQIHLIIGLILLLIFLLYVLQTFGIL